MPGMSISVIVADEFPLIREGMARALDEMDGISVIAQADSGAQALALTLELKPDVLVLDLHIAELGGLAVLSRLRLERPDVKVIIMAAGDEPGPLLDAVSAGAEGYLSKRTTAAELGQAISTAHGGGSVITPALARHLLDEFSARARGGADAARPVMAEREAEILRLVVKGHTDAEIGQALFISPRTVQNHLTRIREKTGLKRRSELTRWAVEHAFV
jgi:two-component system NarL family response regulator